MLRAVITRSSRMMVITTRTRTVPNADVHSEFVSSAKKQHELVVNATTVTTTAVTTTMAATTTAATTMTATTTTAATTTATEIRKRSDRRCSRATRPASA